MENNQELSKDSERRKLQEDIERLQDIIGDDDFNSDDDSDNDILQIDFNSRAPTEGEEEYRQTPGGVSSAAGSVNPTPAEDDREEIVINLNEDVPIDPDTCLALNKAYQEVLLDTLRSIEMALIENRDKQDKIHESMYENPKKTKNTDDKRRTVSSYNRPFFMDEYGHVPPMNTDVLLKKSTDEQRQDIRPVQPWRKKLTNLLTEAVYLDSLGQQTRPLLNRKDICYEKLSQMSREANGEDYDKMLEKIDELDEEINKFSSMPREEIIDMGDSKRIDWLKISNTTLNNARDPYECELYWNSVLKPSINKKEWAKEEKEELKKLAEKYNGKNWTTIAKELGTNRTAFQCLQYYQQNLNDLFMNREWTELEDQSLLEVVENCRVGMSTSWTQVSYFMDGRSSVQCAFRYMQINPEVKRGKWTEEEDMKLLSAVYMYGDKDWEKISEFVPNRHTYQCRERYKSSLDPRLRPPDVWTYEEDRWMLNVCEEMRKPDGKIPWARVAERLEGRSDNMVLSRYRKLMEWKEKCDWLEKQDDEHKRDLGYIDLDELAKGDKSKAGRIRKIVDKPTELDYKRLMHQLSKLPVSEYRLDYVKQLKDKHEGNMIVPRPPLMYRYTRRNVVNIWARKKHMKTLLELHLAKLSIAKPEDRVLVPEKTAEEFKPFSSLDKRQIKKVSRVLASKTPCEISVRELIEMATEERPPIEISVMKRAKFKRIDSLVEKRICDILQYKHCYITKWRKPSGRPKKFYIFYPGGRKPNYFEAENTVQLSTVTSTLLLNALEVDGKNSVQKYHTFLPKKRKNLKHLYDILVKCFPHLAVAPVPKATSTVTTATEGQTCTDNENTDPKPTHRRGRKPKKKRGRKKMEPPKVVKQKPEEETESREEVEEVSKILDSFVDKARKQTSEIGEALKSGTESKVMKQEIVSPVKPSVRKRKSKDKPIETPASKVFKIITVTGALPSSVASSTVLATTSAPVVASSAVTLVTSPTATSVVSLQTTTSVVSRPTTTSVLPSTSSSVLSSTDKMPRIVKLNQSISSKGPVPTALIMNASVNRPGQRTMVLPNMVAANPLKPGQQMPASNPRVIVINKPPAAAVQNRFPILPPCVTTMRGYEEFLIQSNLLKSRAGEEYNPYFYHEKSMVLKQRLEALSQGNNTVSKLDFNDKVDRALEIGAKRVNAILCGRGVRLEKPAPTVHPKKDLLKDLRKTDEYIKLKKRFDALFLWPAFLSLLKPDKENIFDKQEQDKNLLTFDEYIDTVEAETPKEPVETVVVEDTEDDPVEVQIKQEQAEVRKKQLGNFFNRVRQKRLAKKTRISNVRRMAKQYQIKSIAEKGRERIRAERKAKEEEKLKEKKEKFGHLGQRSSQRVIKKRILDTAKELIEPKKPHKLRSLQTITREMEKEKNSSNPQEPVKPKVKYKRYKPKTVERGSHEVEDQEPEVALPAGFFMVPQQNPVGMVPLMISPSSQGTSQVNQTSGVFGNMVPMILRQNIAATPDQTGLVQQTSVQTSGMAPQGIMQPMILMPQPANSSSPAGMTPFPVFLMSNMTEPVGTIASASGKESDIAQQSTGVFPLVTGQNQQQLPSSSGAASSVLSIDPLPQSKSVDNSDKSEMSHVFLGTAPGQEGSPVLISVPKDSNMTVKELIQMMGKGGESVVLNPGGDNSEMEVDSSEKNIVTE